MSEVYDIEVTVLSQTGNCGAGHKVGDKWLIENHTPGGICLSAYQVMEPYCDVLKYGGTYPWQQDPDVTLAVCPDPGNPVVFQLKRLKKSNAGK
ncbi:MAG: TIGR04076 family protein [Dehalococcoidales bacterium]|jgi:uncharacterized repeat protein (TIGR04076 family)